MPADVCLQCGMAAPNPDITFCRRCGLPFGAQPRSDATLPTCPVCYQTVGDDGRLPSHRPQLGRVDLVSPHGGARPVPRGRRRPARVDARRRPDPDRSLGGAVRPRPALPRHGCARRRPPPLVPALRDRHRDGPAGPLGPETPTSSATSRNGATPARSCPTSWTATSVARASPRSEPPTPARHSPTQGCNSGFGVANHGICARLAICAITFLTNEAKKKLLRPCREARVLGL